jgi:hypothetical protein
MKTNFQALMTALTVAGTLFISVPAPAQDTTVQPAMTATVPHLDYGASQILQMAQAKVNDDTLVVYIKNSGNSYALNADQIIYLRQQGVSDAVITTMLNQPRVGLVSPATPAATSQPVTSTATTVVADPAPTVTYVQTVPATTYYYPDYNYNYAPAYYPYYSAYGYYPGVSFSFGWGGGWRGGGWHGGYGGWHGDNHWHGGGFGGGWHGGGGGGWHGGGHR